MDLNIRKPLHIFALIVILFTLFLLVVSPILSFFGVFHSMDDGTMTSEFAVLLGSIIAVLIFIWTPLIWYLLVNKLGIKKILHDALKLRMERIGLMQHIISQPLHHHTSTHLTTTDIHSSLISYPEQLQKQRNTHTIWISQVKQILLMGK